MLMVLLFWLHPASRFMCGMTVHYMPMPLSSYFKFFQILKWKQRKSQHIKLTWVHCGCTLKPSVSHWIKCTFLLPRKTLQTHDKWVAEEQCPEFNADQNILVIFQNSTFFSAAPTEKPNSLSREGAPKSFNSDQTEWNLILPQGSALLFLRMTLYHLLSALPINKFPVL